MNQDVNAGKRIQHIQSNIVKNWDPLPLGWLKWNTVDKFKSKIVKHRDPLPVEWLKWNTYASITEARQYTILSVETINKEYNIVMKGQLVIIYYAGRNVTDSGRCSGIYSREDI